MVFSEALHMLNVNWQGGGVWNNFVGDLIAPGPLTGGAPVYCLSFSINLNQSQEFLKADGRSFNTEQYRSSSKHR